MVTIAQPGTYRVTGSISKGQIAVDLGEESREDANAVVNLILDNAEINCTAASGIVVLNAFECGSDEAETASKDVDTTGAGFNLILADDSENIVNGSHVAKIYKEGTTQEEVDAGEAKKAWKFDAAIDSLVSYNINGETTGNGILTVNADNEGISSALHMTINGGTLVINSNDDAINTSEDYVSVLTVNGGTVTCDSGFGSEGDGIDSNGWIVVNDGYIIAGANGISQDSGVDAELGIYLNGGTVLAGGNMYDEVSEESAQKFMVLSFAQTVEEEQILLLKNSADEAVIAFAPINNCQIMVLGSGMLEDGDYTLYKVSSVTGDLNGSIYTNITDYADAVQLQYSSSIMMGMGGRAGFGGQKGQMRERMELPEGAEAGEMPGGMQQGELPEGAEAGQMPERMELPEGVEAGQMPGGMQQGELPEGAEAGQAPDGMNGRGMGRGNGAGAASGERSSVFTISGIANQFSQITEMTSTDTAGEIEENTTV